MVQLSTALVHQETLAQKLSVIFPHEKTYANSRKKSFLKYPKADTYIELDLWIPKYHLCFEFQDAYHYVTTWYYQGSVNKIQRLDNMKKSTIQKKGMTLVIVPCWWDGTSESLVASILFHRPDIPVLLPNKGREIPLNPPLGYFSLGGIPGVGELMLASFLKDDFAIDPGGDTSWWMGEKYDGIRCCWNPSHKQLYSRNGKVLYLLDSLLRLLPLQFLDGEIWFGRGNFVAAQSVVFADSESLISWHYLRFIAFDIASIKLRFKTFERRYRQLFGHVTKNHPFLIVAHRMICRNISHLKDSVQKIIDGMGEGLILRKVGSLYESGRSTSLSKLKAFESDKEGVVAGKEADGSVSVRLPDNTSFPVSRENILTHEPLKIGDIVSVSCESHARREIPVNPKIYRIRRDLTWSDVVQNAVEEKRVLNESSPTPGFSPQRIGHWKAKTMRLFLEKFARDRNLDPLAAETWYNTPSDDIRQVTGGATVIEKMKGGYFHVLNTLFPEIGLEKNKFISNKNTWTNIESRRAFFENYAKDHNFDPKIAENWYTQPSKNFFAIKGAHRLLSYHKFSVSQALMDLFPDVEFNTEKFTPAHYLWHDITNRRKFFLNYARKEGFDPFVAENWYAQPSKNILAVKGAKSILFYHKNSVSTALIELFPDVALSRSHFVNYFWRDPKYRRQFFEDYARENQFDPLKPQNWYPQSMEKIMACKGAKVVMYYHNNSVANALTQLFPNIGLDRSKFHFTYKFRSEDNRRQFFIDFAHQNNFDPFTPENWYTQPSAKILAVPGAMKVIRNHGRSIMQSLFDLFPNIGLDKSKFAAAQLWKDARNRRQFFEEYAQKMGFDFRDVQSWYSQRTKDFISVKGAAGVIMHHNRSLSQALIDLFPELDIQKSQFSKKGLAKKTHN